MGHKRFIPSDISTDRRFAALLEGDGGILAGLCYTLGVVHADDWGRFTGDPVEFKLSCFPTAPANSAEIERALHAVAEVGLWQLYERDGRKVIQLPQDEFWQTQTYVSEKRRQDCKSKFPPPPGTPDDRVPRKKGGEEDDDDRDDEQNESADGSDNQNLRKSTIIVHSHSHSDSEQGKTRLNAVVVDSVPIDIERLIRMAEEAGIKIKRSELAELARKYGQEWVEDAIEITAEADHPTTHYLMAVLRRWERNGGPDGTYVTEAMLLEAKKRKEWKNRPPDEIERERGWVWQRIWTNDPQTGGAFDHSSTCESPEKTHQSVETSERVSGDGGGSKKPSEGRLEAHQEPFDTSKLKIADDLRAFWHDFDMLTRIHGHEKAWQALRELADDGPVTAAALSHKLNHPAKKSG